MKAEDSREQVPDSARGVKPGYWHAHQARAGPERCRDAPYQLGRRKVHAVAYKESLVSGFGRSEHGANGFHHVINVGEAPPVSNRAERQR